VVVPGVFSKNTGMVG